MVRKIPWRRKRQPIPVFLPGEVHGQRSLAGSSPWGYKELDTIERLALLLPVFLGAYVLHICNMLHTYVLVAQR